MHVMPRQLFATALVFGGLVVAPRTARAAESYDNCNNFIDSVPATISTQGVWCLRHDLSTNITSGAAITIATNNVTIDCNDFKLGGLAAGDSSQANGIQSDGRQNATVRRCNVRGFSTGISIADGAGHLVEDNRLDNNLSTGILVTGDNSLVQRNRVFDTGGAPNNSTSYGIVTAGDALDNTVAGAFATATSSAATGISIQGDGTEAHGNRIRGLVTTGTGYFSIAIDVHGQGNTIDGNRIADATANTGTGINGAGATNTFCSNNTVAKFATPIGNCQDAGGNASN